MQIILIKYFNCTLSFLPEIKASLSSQVSTFKPSNNFKPPTCSINCMARQTKDCICTHQINGCRKWVVYFSTYTYPPYSTSDLRQIRYTTHLTYQHVVLQLLYALVAAVPSPLACPGHCARPPSLSQPQTSAKKSS